MNLNDTSRFNVVNWIPARCPTGPNKWPNSLIMVVTNDGNHIVVDCNEILCAQSIDNGRVMLCEMKLKKLLQEVEARKQGELEMCSDYLFFKK